MQHWQNTTGKRDDDDVTVVIIDSKLSRMEGIDESTAQAASKIRVASGDKALPHKPVIVCHHAVMHVVARRQIFDDALVLPVPGSRVMVAGALSGIITILPVLSLDANYVKRKALEVVRLQH